MRILIIPVLVTIIAISFTACGSKSGASFCDTACFSDTLKFSDDSHPLKPYVWITARDCNADTIVWSYTDMGTNRKLDLPDLVGAPVRLNKSKVDCFIKDTSYAWVSFNDCDSRRGFLVKIPFNKRDKISAKSSAINALDPKFAVDPSLVAYTDRGNIFAEDKITGKTATLTFGKRIEIDYNAMHNFIDSVSITRDRIWAKVKIDNEWKELEKKITID